MLGTRVSAAAGGHPRRRRLIALFCAVSLLSMMLITAPAGLAGGTDEWNLSHAGRWLIDSEGRVVILHGENVVMKRAPWVASAIGFSDDDAVFLAQNGFNVVRLGFLWAGVEPEPGMYNDALLAQIRDEVQMLHSHGIGVLLDSHQDMFSSKYQGDGFPDWALNDSGLPNPPLGFPLNYDANLAEQQSWNNFWADRPSPNDSVGVQDRYVAMWHHVAAYFAQQPGILGYELLNEPMPGTGAAACLLRSGCGHFEATELTGFYQRVTNTIRQVDPHRLVFYEPVPTFAFGLSTTSVRDGDPSAVFSFHNYCLSAQAAPALPLNNLVCPLTDKQVFEHADLQAARTGDGDLLSEFGASSTTTDLEADLSDADADMLGWIEWEYCNCNEVLGSTAPVFGTLVTDENKPPVGTNVNQQLLKLLERPYPQMIAGTPKSFGYDPTTRTMRLAYLATAVPGAQLAPGSLTQLFVPPEAYPGGRTIHVAGGHIASSNQTASTIEVAADQPGALVTVTIEPGA